MIVISVWQGLRQAKSSSSNDVHTDFKLNLPSTSTNVTPNLLSLLGLLDIESNLSGRLCLIDLRLIGGLLHFQVSVSCRTPFFLHRNLIWQGDEGEHGMRMMKTRAVIGIKA